MSIDVNYYSFSPSRADKLWSHFVEDVSVLRKKHAGWKSQEMSSEERQKKAEEVEMQFRPQIREMAQKIFQHFDAKGYTIPEVEWFSDQEIGQAASQRQIEEKMRYLKTYGCVYPKGTKRGEKGQPYLMLHTDAPELEALYDEKIREYEGIMYGGLDSFKVVTPEGEKIVLNEQQKLVDESYCLDYLLYEDQYDYDQLINDLKYLDIFYGSVRNEYFEDPKLEYLFLEILIEKFQLKTEEEFPTKEEWIRAFQNITPENMRTLIGSVRKDLHWSQDEAEAAVTNYLKSIRPVIKDLKETTDSFFLRVYGGMEEFEPSSVDATLVERAKQHAKLYKGSIAPVL